MTYTTISAANLKGIYFNPAAPTKYVQTITGESFICKSVSDCGMICADIYSAAGVLIGANQCFNPSAFGEWIDTGLLAAQPETYNYGPYAPATAQELQDESDDLYS